MADESARLLRPIDEAMHQAPKEAKPDPPLLRECLLCELVGTFFLVLTVGVSVASETDLAAVAIGLVLTVQIYAAGAVSGAFFNPAVTLAVLLSGRGKIAPGRAALYMVVQVVGGILGGAVAYGVSEKSFCFHTPHRSLVGSWTLEILFTMILCSIVLAAGTSKDDTPNQYFGFAIGSAVMGGALSCGGFDQGSFNPAVTIGINVANYMNSGAERYPYWYSWTAFTFAPMIGAGLAAAVFYGTRGRECGLHTEAPLLRERLLAEFMGTFSLVLTVGVAVAGGGKLAAVAIGLILAVQVYTFASVSGACLNPAVVLAILLSGWEKLTPKDAAFYTGVQTLAAIIAGLVASGASGDTFAFDYNQTRSWSSSFELEVLFTMALCGCVLAVGTSKDVPNQYFGFAIGSTVIGSALACRLSIDQGSYNPAVTVGINLANAMNGQAANKPGLACWFLFIAAPLVGAALAAAVFRGTRFHEYKEFHHTDGHHEDAAQPAERGANSHEHLEKGVAVTHAEHAPSGSTHAENDRVAKLAGAGAKIVSYVESEAAFQLGERLLAEFVGTFFLVLTVGVTIAGAGHGGWAAVAIGLLLAVQVYTFATVSGACLNPAVTLAVLLSGRNKITLADAGLYMVAQVIGAILASLCAFAATGATFCFDYELTLANSAWTSIMLEILFTMALCGIVLTAGTSKDAPNQYFGFAIGCAVMAGALASSGSDQGSFNPAVTIGINLGNYANHDATHHPSVGAWFLFLFAPFIGGALAAVVFRATRRDEYNKDVKIGLQERVLAELVGTFFLVFTVGIAVASKGKLAAVAIGLMLAVQVYTFASVSGACLNPAVTLAVALSGRGKMEPAAAAFYMAAQFLGAELAGFVSYGVTGTTFCFAHVYSKPTSLTLETVFTMALCSIVLAAGTSKDAPNQYYGFAIGCAVVGGALASPGFDQGSFNPAVTMGMNIANYANGDATQHPSVHAWLVFTFAPFLGGCLAAAFFRGARSNEYTNGPSHERVPLRHAGPSTQLE